MLRNVDIPPTPNHLSYLQADFIEFSCLTHENNYISQSDILNLLSADADINEHNEYNRLANDIPDNSDLQIHRIHEWFAYLKYRENVYYKAYPFSVSYKTGLLELKNDLNHHQLLYIYLLMASSLRHFDGSARYHISSSFEVICAEAMRQYIGDKAVIKIFGKGPSSEYSGNKYSRLSQLAVDICETLCVSEDRFASSDSADEGLDIVGWLPPLDKNPGRLLVFGQCACGLDWKEKQHSSGYDKWHRLVSLSVRPINTIFIPYCFRDASGNWYADDQIHLTLMIDRLRIMRLVDSIDYPLELLTSPVKELIQEVLYTDSTV